jgi:hypothetical protein
MWLLSLRVISLLLHVPCGIGRFSAARAGSSEALRVPELKRVATNESAVIRPRTVGQDRAGFRHSAIHLNKKQERLRFEDAAVWSGEVVSEEIPLEILTVFREQERRVQFFLRSS